MRPFFVPSKAPVGREGYRQCQGSLFGRGSRGEPWQIMQHSNDAQIVSALHRKLAVQQARQKCIGAMQIAPMLCRERSAFLELLSNINELYIIGLLTIFAKSAMFISVISTRMKRVLTIPREGG